jgi:hypothetical protein
VVMVPPPGLPSAHTSRRPTAGLPLVAHPVVVVEEPRRTRTLAKIAVLIAVTAVSVPLCAAIVVGGAVLAFMTLH